MSLSFSSLSKKYFSLRQIDPMLPFKKLFPAMLLAGIFITASCTKEEEELSRSEGYLKFKINDKWTSWTLGKADIVLDAKDYSRMKFNLGANNSSKDSSIFLSFGMEADGVEPGTYPLETASFLVSLYGEIINYRENGNISGMPAPKYSITLTQIDEKYIRGNFSGNHLVSAYLNGYIALTEGEFLLPATIHESPF